MYAFAEPVTSEEICDIQTRKHLQVRDFEERVLGLSDNASKRREDFEAEVEAAIASDDEAPEGNPPDSHSPEVVDDAGMLYTGHLGPTSLPDPSAHALESRQQIDGVERSCSAVSEQRVGETVSGIDQEKQAFIPIPQPLEFETHENEDSGAAPTEAHGPDEVFSSQIPSISSVVPTKPLLAMVVTVSNKVDGKPVLRPKHLGAAIDGSEVKQWTVDYTVKVVGNSSRAHALYLACQRRRRTVFEKEAIDYKTNGFLKQVRQYARKGSKWRRAEEERRQSEGKEVVTLI